MERQRSFAFKPTRFFVFSFAISSSIILFSFFSIWVVKTVPIARQENLVHFNKPFRTLGGIRPITLQTLNSYRNNFSENGEKKSIRVATHFQMRENNSGFVGISVLSEKQRIEDEPKLLEEMDKDDGVDRNFTMRPSVNDASSKKIETQAALSVEILYSDGNEKKQVEIVSSGKIGLPGRDKFKKRAIRDCDLTKGRWVFDESYPLYTNGSCPFIDEGFDCEGNGRLDKDYMKWRWRPQDCNIPRFNATKMLELIRGKRLVFVGDSINRNQWESLLCMLVKAIKDPKKVYETRGRRITKEKGNYSFRFVDYKCTVEYYVTHFLVHEGKARIGQKRVPTLRIDSIDHGSSRWRGADILVFNTAHWWSHSKTKAGINYYQERGQVHPRLDVTTAFRRALMTWSSWVDKYINPKKTRVFFRSSAPSHFRGGQWNSGGHCLEATQPLNETSIINYKKNIIVEEVIRQMKTPVTLLNITGFSDYRIDGHPSIYGRKHQSLSIQDCSHWCLPGVPDTWNELLYYHLKDRVN